MTKITALALLTAMTACAGRQTPTPPPPPPAEPPPPVVEAAPPTLPELLKQIETAYRRGNYTLGLSLVKKALEIKQNDVSSMDRIGSIYYVLGRYGEAVTIWGRALPLEQDLQKRRALENSIAVARRSLGLVDTEPAPAPEPPVPAGKPPKVPPVKAPAASPAEIQALYKKGIKYYASGEYLQATTLFLRILELDPGNPDATKALKRLQLGP
ncbi:MAG: hypothetical protein HYZ74_03650 [Elusimicrobia bacterium]|nr:hypothetical protein [Elusimicrobiota bacterium]